MLLSKEVKVLYSIYIYIDRCHKLGFDFGHLLRPGGAWMEVRFECGFPSGVLCLQQSIVFRCRFDDGLSGLIHQLEAHLKSFHYDSIPLQQLICCEGSLTHTIV